MSTSKECWNIVGALGEAPLSSERSALVLYSLHAVTKKTSTVPRGFGRTSPRPGPGSMVQLCSSDVGRSFNFFCVGERLPGPRITSIEPPPAFLHVEPTCSLWNEGLMQPRMILQPCPRRLAVMTAQIIGDDVDISCRIGLFDGL
jgi:hypothetical protein